MCHVCERKMWLYHRGIRMQLENESVLVGMQIDAAPYPRETKGVALGCGGVVDRVDLKNGTIYETKKGPATERAAMAQLKFYLWWLRERAVPVDEGVLSYPTRRQKRTLEWFLSNRSGFETKESRVVMV